MSEDFDTSAPPRITPPENISGSSWEQKILFELERDETVFIVARHTAAKLRLWHLFLSLYPYQQRFRNMREFALFVLCDCPAGDVDRVPNHASVVYIHTKPIHWGYIEKPKHTEIKEE